jgi:TonB family protein
MGYQALLFCPDEKLARVVSQVFSELDFTVDPVHEPFAAVKKLMAQRFDAIVVDCENEQNASLLFKSARNSSSNQSSLAIALVEGQAGVAKAYRIGANLVLTKPINVEQAKGTLRVARGLLRKNSDAASTSTTSAATPVTPAQTPQTSSEYSSPTSQAPTRTPLSFAASAPSISSVPSVASVGHPPRAEFTQDADFTQDKDQPLAIVPDVAQSHLPAMSASAEVASVADNRSEAKTEDTFPNKPSIKNNAVSPIEESPAAFSTASEAIPHSFPGVKQAPAALSALAQNPSTPFTSAAASNTASPTGSAAATAPAKEVATVPVQESVKGTAPAPATASLQSVSSAAPSFVFDTATTSDAPSFGTLSGEGDSDGAGGNKKMLIAAAAVLAFAALGYVGYTKMSGDHVVPTPQPVSSSQNLGQTSSAPAVTSSPSTVLSTTSSAKPNLAALSSFPAPATPKIAVTAAPEKIAVGNGNPPTIHIGVDTAANGAPNASSVTGAATKKPVSSPIQVKSNDGVAGQVSSDDSAPSLSAPSAAAPGTNSLNSLMSSTSSTSPIPTLATVRVSQGVSQGLVIKRVQPKYPPAALAARTAGVVQIEATVSKDGTVTNAKVLSGDLVLAHAALEAVRQWRYKPYYLDGVPVEIQTQITVNFKAN